MPKEARLRPGWRASLTMAGLLVVAVVLIGCGSMVAPPTPPDRNESPAAAPAQPPPAEPQPGIAPADPPRTSGSPDLDADRGASGDGYLVPQDLAGAAEELATQPEGTGVQIPRGESWYGGDISWPQCPAGMGIEGKKGADMPLPTADARYVIIGLTNGPSFYPNPCLQQQLDWAKQKRLWVAAYAVVSYPHGDDLAKYGDLGPYNGAKRLGALRNVGYQAARFNIATMTQVGLSTPIVWVDVEPVPIFEWSDDVAANAAVVEGTVRGYEEAGYRVGFYSTPALWRGVVGDLRFGGPEWRAAGETSSKEALRRCKPDWTFQGGPGVMGQWLQERRDHNLTCPDAITTMSHWFTQY